jgi:type I restriction enzyme, S subunit
MADWKECKLGDFVDVINGFAFKSSNFLDSRENNSLPIIKIKNVANGDVNINGVQYHLFNDSLLRFIVSKGDVLIALTGNHPHAQTQVVGEASRYKLNEPALLNQRVANIKAKKGLDIDYLYYFLKDDITHDYLASQSSGSANQANISKSDLENIPIQRPELPEQKAIAEVLSSLDDKIDLLHRQNKTLEAMAETLFRQWFVEEAEESWESGETYELGELVDTISKTHKFESNQVVFLNTSDIYAGQVINHEYSEVKTLPGQAKKSIQKHDILYSEIRPANKRFAYVDFDANDYVVSTKLMVLRIKGLISPAIIYFYLTNSQTLAWLQMLAESRSGTFPQITFDQVKEMKINIPTGETLQNITNWTESTIIKLSENHRQIRKLTNLRDTLLPKLMSGEEVRVKIENSEI